jgi:hypothetical protein
MSIRLAAAGCALMLAASPARGEDELLGAPESEVQFLPRPGETATKKSPPKAVKKSAPQKAAKKVVAKPPAKVAARPVAVAKAAPSSKPAVRTPKTVAKVGPNPRSMAVAQPAPRPPAQNKPSAIVPAPYEPDVEEVGEVMPVEAPYDDEGAPFDSGDQPAPARSDGESAGFFVEPTIDGERVVVDYYYWRGSPRRAEEAATDDFCQQMGYRRGAYYSIVRLRQGDALEDVLCLR